MGGYSGSAWVVGGSIVSFVYDIAEEQKVSTCPFILHESSRHTEALVVLSIASKNDVRISTLFAQLSADAQYDRYKQPNEWYAWYNYILQALGWTTSWVYT